MKYFVLAFVLSSLSFSCNASADVYEGSEQDYFSDFGGVSHYADYYESDYSYEHDVKGEGISIRKGNLPARLYPDKIVTREKIRSMRDNVRRDRRTL